MQRLEEQARKKREDDEEEERRKQPLLKETAFDRRKVGAGQAAVCMYAGLAISVQQQVKAGTSVRYCFKAGWVLFSRGAFK